MNPDVQEELIQEELIQDLNSTDFISTEASGQVTSFSGSETNEQWNKVVDKTTAFLADLPDYLTEFFGQYKRPIVTVGLIFGSVIAVKLTLAILNSINEIPLLSPTFELIGLGYSAWFIYRYLLRASNRKELSSDFNELKAQVLGQRNQNAPKL